MSKAGVQRLLSRRMIHVCDCRSNSVSQKKNLETSGLDYNDFLRCLRKIFSIHQHEILVLATTDRTVLDFDKFAELQDGETLYLLHNENQPLPVAVEEHIKFTPHFETLIQSGIHEYYASEGKKPLPYALAELIDNALSATAKNTGMRSIEIRMLFDESLGKPAVVVLDNGRGMTSKQLKNWAVYRLSKFTRAKSTLANQQEEYLRPDPVPRSLNSDISYFGVGGKQAVFYIGDSVRMISKPAGSPDVHELVLSKEEFERKEKNKEDVYGGIIKNREPGDSSHVVNSNDRSIHTVIAEERGKESFTAVVITGIPPEHLIYLKDSFQQWTRDLAHTYHYYIHGASGNDMNSSHTNLDNLPKIDIQVNMQEKPPKFPRAINLREIDNDMQTLYINAAAATFEFKATTPDGGRVEGLIRYHPFLYDRETYPKDPDTVPGPQKEEDDENEVEVRCQTRVKRQIFECFWNGRLIPYTTVSEFDWCSWTKRSKVPEECYGRFSGVLFANDKFQVSTNKLTFIDLEQKVKSADTILTRVLNGQEQRNVDRQFLDWLLYCHEKLDKQVKFLDFSGIITRNDVPTKKMQHPWAKFTAIELDGRTYERGKLVKSQKTQPIIHGTIIQFLLYGDHDKDVFATGGQVEISLEPKALYNRTKIMPISKIDRTATDEGIKKNIENDLNKLPELLQVDWPDGNPWPQNGVRPAGTPLGALTVKILNKKGDSMSRMPAVDQKTVIKLSVKLTLVQHVGDENDEEIVSLAAQHSAKWGFGFRKIEKLTNPGKYTLCLTTIINETSDTMFGGRKLPSYKLRFNITEGSAEAFVMDGVSSTLRVGVPFDIPLQLKDAYGNSAVPPSGLKPLLACSDLALSYETVDSCGKKLIIRGVKAKGKVLNYQQSQTYDLKVTLPGLKKDTQTTKISLLPGNPHTLHVKGEGKSFILENGNPARFDVEIHDEAGNITAHSKQTVRCKVDGLPPAAIDCSRTGAGQLVTKPIELKFTTGEPQMLRVVFEILNSKTVAKISVQLKVMPSKRVVLIKLWSSQGDENLELKDKERIEWLAGGSLEKLVYKLYDEAGRQVLLTDEIASKIKVNWTRHVNLKDVAQGKLPVVQVSKQVQDEQFCLVSYQEESVSVSFTIVPHPDDPASLKTTELQNPVKLGETVSENLNLELVDQYKNPTKTLTSACVNHMTVEAEGLDKFDVTFKWQESSRSIQVAGIRFQTGTPGIREMRFKYLSYMANVIIKVTAGDPSHLKLVSGPKEPLQVVNDHSIPTPFVVQLFDKWGNTSSDKRVVVELRSSLPALKVTTPVTSQPVNSQGKVFFTVDSVSGPKGSYQLDFRGSFNNKPIPGPSVDLTVLPDPNKPVKLLVEYDTTAKIRAGGTFPVFLVTVMSDEGIPMTTFKPAAVSMFLWEGEPSERHNATELKCSVPMKNDRRNCFHFRDKVIPTRTGKCTIQFSLHVGQTENLHSDQIPINVMANQPVRLGPTVQPPAPVVSCSTDVASRTLVNNLILRIMDSYENPAGQDLQGRVVVSIASDDSSKRTPLFDGKLNRYHMNMVQGEVHIRRLSIMENSPGENGSQYTLLFNPEVPAIPTPLAPFKLTFHFYVDAVNQQKMSGLLKKKEELSLSVERLKEVFDDYKELLKMLRDKYLAAVNKAVVIRDQLMQKHVEMPESPSIAAIDTLLMEKTNESEALLQGQNRVCSVQDSFSGQQDVLGKIGHLAHVQDDAAARVISWHIRGDMDCVVTRTLAAAERIHKDTGGRQQVMALESMFRPQVSRTLPHIRNGRMLFNSVGNPVHAREHLIFLQDKESCDIVFKNILRDTILIDDLHSGNNYRRSVVQTGIQCPTILTRQGDRISSMGKFGGLQNKAPSTNSFPVFGAPHPPQYYILQEQKELLRQYRGAVEKSEAAENDHNNHLENMNSPDTKKKEEDMVKMKKQLAEIERQLDSTPGRPLKRGAGEAHGIDKKRAK
ncbi:structural maintenance of chromosomes flexible hinge domain-containing protein 1 [Solea senegalensis]|uniref:Structural maintenance of chromosomes flexible hinge domain-containing protein 1 n=1 Tax=Solea senegalensis TaxID=28829 RepID=A0AAV6T3N6_SOLSE|nr:structural maintenance of chromosomes flexible hinge domain-containing protein 1 isoform X1 [Solea senegalensis]KAG7523924.1 structural maintenance of chromosomes flexible hinge domain-containing protein 1 [Solea senegalensis]